jgi:hypothetical protein
MKRSKLQRTYILGIILFTSCTTKQQPNSNTIVLSYHEIGPQVAVYKLIGKEWYQWNSHGSPNPQTVDDVKVVVYRNISLDKVKEIYPVVIRKQDYRYLDYETAIKYLNKNAGEASLKNLQATKQKINEQLGDR